MTDWKNDALLLKEQGLSSRAIGKMLGKGKSTINDYLSTVKKMFANDEVSNENVKSGPRVLFIDIETSSLSLAGWRLFDQNFSLNQIERDWFLLSFCAKWGDSDELFYMDKRNAVDMYDDKEILKTIWTLMNEAHYIVGQNSKRFDTKKINAKFIEHGFPPPSPYRQIDTLEQSKRSFAFTSHKLEYMTDLLCTKYKKSTHGKFAGYELWRQCLLGNIEAFEEIEEYNKLDVLSLQELYEKLCVWDTKLPNFSVHNDEVEEQNVWVEDGFVFSNSAKYQCYRNVQTGQFRRGKTNLLSKEKRQSLLANIV